MDDWLEVPAETSNTGENVLLQYVGCATALTAAPTFGTIRLASDYLDTFSVVYVTGSDIQVTLFLCP